MKNVKFILAIVLFLTIKLYGETPWETNPMPSGVSFYDIHFQNANYGVAIGINTNGQTVIYDTDNRGFFWTLRKNFNNSNATYASFSYSVSGFVVALVQDNGQNKIYRSYNGEIANWNHIATVQAGIQYPKVKYFMKGNEELIFYYGFGGNKVWKASSLNWTFNTVYDQSSDPNKRIYGINQGKSSNQGIYMFGGKDDENPNNRNPILAYWNYPGFTILYDGGENSPDNVGLIFDIDTDPVYQGSGNDVIVGVSSRGYCHGILPDYTLTGYQIFLGNHYYYPPENSYISVKNSSEAALKIPRTAEDYASIIYTENGGNMWDREYDEYEQAFLLQSSLQRSEDVLYALWSENTLSRRLLNTNLITYSDIVHPYYGFTGSMKVDGQTYGTSGASYIRGGLTSFQALSPLINGTKIFYKWVDNSTPNLMNPYKTEYFSNIGNTFSALYKTKLTADKAGAISNPTQTKAIRDTNGIINQIHESIGGIFYSRSTDNGVNFSTEEVVNGGKEFTTNLPSSLSANNNSSPSICELRKLSNYGIPFTGGYADKNMAAAWQRYYLESGIKKIEIKAAIRTYSSQFNEILWRKYGMNTNQSYNDGKVTEFTVIDQNFNSKPVIIATYLGDTYSTIEDTREYLILIPHLEPLTNGGNKIIVSAKCRNYLCYDNIGGGGPSSQFKIDEGNITDFSVISEPMRGYGVFYNGLKLYFTYKKDNNIYYRADYFVINSDNYPPAIVRSYLDILYNVASIDGQGSRYAPDISLRNGLPVIAWQGSTLKTRTIVYEQGNEETMITNQYPIIARYKYSTNGGTNWSTLVKYDSPPNVTQQNPNVEGCKNKNAFLINYSVNNSIFKQDVKFQEPIYDGYFCCPNTFPGVDAKLVRGSYIDYFGQNSHPMLITLAQKPPPSNLYEVSKQPFTITNIPCNAISDNYTNLEGIVRDSNIYYYFNLGPILVKNTFVSPEMGMDGPIYYTVQNPMEFNENMISRPFLLSNGDTLILGGTGKYDQNPNEHFFIKKYNVGLFKQSDNQIQQLLFSDTINTGDTIESEYLRGFIINNISGNSDSFYVQLLIDSSDISWGTAYSYSCVYSPDEIQGDNLSNFKSKVHFQNQNEHNISNTPKTFSLSQNYPNPFNPATTIKYELPKDAFVTIKVYDIVGREIFTLVNENKQAGYYSVDFNGINFASGVYFYRIKAGDFSSVKRMVLIK